MFTGVYTAIITPFNQDGSIDELALRDLVESQISKGINGLVPVGTTGESPTVSHEENIKIIKIVVEAARGRVPVIAGTGSNSTQEALEMTKMAKDLGVQGSLQVVPYYNKPNQEGMYRHFMTIADKVDLPMILYNVPGRSAKNLESSTIIKLSEHKNIRGIKDATGGIVQTTELLCAKLKDFSILSGDDGFLFPTLALGGHGVISVASHIVPEDLLAIVKAMNNNEIQKAREIHLRLVPLFNALFIDTNPIAIKYALSLLNQCQEVYRLPLTPLCEEHKAVVRKALADLGK